MGAERRYPIRYRHLSSEMRWPSGWYHHLKMRLCHSVPHVFTGCSEGFDGILRIAFGSAEVQSFILSGSTILLCSLALFVVSRGVQEGSCGLNIPSSCACVYGMLRRFLTAFCEWLL